MLTRVPSHEPPQPRARAAALALTSIAALLALRALHALWPFTVDDAYITLRYARNLAAGLGPVYNASGPRAEGYSSPLWMALLALPHLLRLDAVLAAKALGVAAFAATAALASRLARSGGAPAAVAPLAAALLLARPESAVHAVSGMETALFTLLLTALAAAAARTVTRARASASLPLLALLTALTRPEGNLAALVTLVACAAMLPAPERARLVRGALLGYVLPAALYMSARWAYYGLPFPLPFYVKLAHPGALPGLDPVREWLGGQIGHLGAWLLLALAPPPRALRPAACAALALTLFFVLPQHLMGYQSRYLAPLDPLLAALAAIGLARLGAALTARGRIATAAPLVFAALTIAGLAFGQRAVIDDRLTYARGLAAAHLPLGRALAARHTPHARLVMSDGGATPYTCGWWTLDLTGLDDAAIATSHRRDPARVLALAPDVVVLVSRDSSRFMPWDWNAYEAPIDSAITQAGYRPVGISRFASDYWLWEYARTVPVRTRPESRR